MEFKLEIKNLALSDSKGHDLKKDIVVRVTTLGNKQVFVQKTFFKLFPIIAYFIFPCQLGVDLVQGKVCKPQISNGRNVPTASG